MDARGQHFQPQGPVTGLLGHGAHVPMQPQMLSPDQLRTYSTQYIDRSGVPVVAATEQALADPETRELVRQQAVEVGGQVVVVAKHYGRQSIVAFQDYIQQGPRAVSTLCFVGGIATSVLGGMGLSNFGSMTLDPFHYILNAYLFIFGVVTTLLETDTDRVGTMMTPFDRLAGPITRCQAFLHEECRLLTRLRGRGLFYLYQGTLMVTQCVLCLLFLGGLYNVLIGALCICMSFGIQPDFEYFMSDGSHGKYAHVPPEMAQQLGAYEAQLQGADLAQQFARAEAAWQESDGRLPGKACRELYALHQQARHGDVQEAKPDGVFNGNAKEQWRLWTQLRGMSVPDAQREFVKRLRKEGISY